MKKIIGLLVALFLGYFLFQIAYSFFSKGHIVEYIIKKEHDFTILEKLTQNTKNETNNYYFEITVNGNTFSFQTFEMLNRESNVIKEVKYFKNANYECILPVLKNSKLISDMICKKDNIYYYYDSIKNSDPELDNYLNGITFYSKEGYEESKEVLRDNGNLYVYDNIISNHFLSVEYYRGIYNINEKAKYKKINLFASDVYKKDISAVNGKYYVVADYDQEYDFNEFRIVNLETYGKTKIAYDKEISLDSYVQGIIGNDIYIFDRNNKKQYEIDLKTKTVIEVGNETTGIKIFKNSEWISGSAYEAATTNITFSKYSTDNILNNVNYTRVDKVGNSLSGYYYIYQKEGNKYKVYRTNVQNSSNIYYLFETSNIDNINYDKEFIYYNDSMFINYFSSMTGIKCVAKYNDLEFNNNLKISLYVK